MRQQTHPTDPTQPTQPTTGPAHARLSAAAPAGPAASRRAAEIHLQDLHRAADVAADGAGTAEADGLRGPLLFAAAVHVALLSLGAPQRLPVLVPSAPERPIFRLDDLRFDRPEPPPAVREAPPVQRAQRRVAVPATVLPEPLPDRSPAVVPDLSTPEIALIAVAPPPPPPPVAAPDAPRIFAPLTMTRPERIAGREPLYTEIARRLRLEGVVIVQATIDAEGQVTATEVLRGLGFGLTEETLAALATWRFTPATENGTAIPVLYNLTVRFTLAN